MDILAIILTCSLLAGGISNDDTLVRAIVNVQSSAHVYYVGDGLKITPPVYPETMKEALERVEIVERNGGKPLVGLMGLPIESASNYGLKTKDLFDACKNIEVGTAILADLASTCKTGARKPSCILEKFGETIGCSDGFFKDAVLYAQEMIITTNAKNRKNSTDSALQSGIFEGDSSDSELVYWDNRFIFVGDRLPQGEREYRDDNK